MQVIKLCANKVKTLYFVGICRIGKIVIAKATLNYVKLMNNASCFVECIESNCDCYKTPRNILEKLKIKTKPKDLKGVEEILFG